MYHSDKSADLIYALDTLSIHHTRCVTAVTVTRDTISDTGFNKGSLCILHAWIGQEHYGIAGLSILAVGYN